MDLWDGCGPSTQELARDGDQGLTVLHRKAVVHKLCCYLLVLGKQNPSKYWTEYIPSVHYSLGLIPTSAKRRKEKGGMKTKELRDGGRGEAN